MASLKRFIQDERGLDLGIIIRPGSTGLWMPDRVRHDNHGILLFEWVPRLRSYPSFKAALLWRVKRHPRGIDWVHYPLVTS
jgi:hypothetical protein